MAKKKPQAKVVTRELWEYECILRIKGQQDALIWVPEDDERSASYKAQGQSGTGKVRSKTETVRTVKHQDDEVLESTEWVVKAQNLLS